MSSNQTESSGTDTAAGQAETASAAPSLAQILRHVGADPASQMPGATLDPASWMQQLSRALADSGLSIRSVSYSPREVVGSAEMGAALVTCVPTDGGVPRAVIVTPTARRRAKTTLIDSAGVRSRRLTARQLAWTVGLDKTVSPTTWGQISRARPLESLRTPDGDKPDVLRRLRRLVRLEGSTLRAVVIYALVVGILTLATPLAVQSVVNTVAFGTLLQPLVVLTLLLLVGLLFAGGLRALETVVIEYMQRRLFAQMAADLSHRLPEVDSDVARQTDLRELVNRFLDVATLQKVASSMLLDGIGLALQAVVGLVVLAFYHPLLLAFDIVLAAVLVAILLSVGRKAVSSAIGESKAKYAVLAWLQQMAASTPLLRGSSAGVAAIDRADQLTNGYLDKRESHFGLVIRQVVALVVLQAVASAALLGLGGWLVIRGELTLGQLVASELIVTAVVGSMVKFGKHLEQFYDAAASVDKLGQLIDLPLGRSGGKVLPDETPVTLGIADAVLGYEARRSILRDVSLHIEPNQRIALTGSAGSGKSLLLSALAGNVQPLHGVVSLGDDPLPRLRASFVGASIRQLSSLILNPGSLLDNVRFAHPSLEEAEVVRLLERLGATTLLDGLPDRLQTVIAGPHTPLPNDLKLQLCLARELLARPTVLLLDGLLDGASPACRGAVLDTLADLGQTAVIATHHPDVVGGCDRTVHLSDGQLRGV